MNWQQLFLTLLDGEKLTVRFESDSQRNTCRTYLSKIRRDSKDLMTLMDMDETKLEMKKLDNDGKYSLQFVPQEVRKVPFQIIGEESDG